MNDLIKSIVIDNKLCVADRMGELDDLAKDIETISFS